MRTTNDKKDFNLRIRLNDRMYRHLSIESDKRNMSISAYIRELIDNDIRERGQERNVNSDNDIAYTEQHSADDDNANDILDSSARRKRKTGVTP